MQMGPHTLTSDLQKFNKVLTQTIDYLASMPKQAREQFLQTEGLLRQQPSEEAVVTIYNAIKTDPWHNDLRFYIEKKHLKDPHAILTIFRRFFSDDALTFPPLTDTNKQRLLSFLNSELSLKQLLSTFTHPLEKEIATALHNIIYLGQLITQFQQKNKMTPDNVARILAANADRLLYADLPLAESYRRIELLRPQLVRALADKHFSKPFVKTEGFVAKWIDWFSGIVQSVWQQLQSIWRAVTTAFRPQAQQSVKLKENVVVSPLAAPTSPTVEIIKGEVKAEAEEVKAEPKPRGGILHNFRKRLSSLGKPSAPGAADEKLHASSSHRLG